MDILFRVVPRVFRDGASHALPFVNVIDSRGNRDLLRMVAVRARSLEDVRGRYGANTITAENVMAGALMLASAESAALPFPWFLRSATFDCASGRSPHVHLRNVEDAAFQLPGTDLQGLAEPSCSPLLAALGELECPRCRFANTRAALSRPGRGCSPGCVNCGGDVLALLAAAQELVAS